MGPQVASNSTLLGVVPKPHGPMNAKLYHSRRHELFGYPEAAGKGGQPSPESCMPEDSPGGFQHVVGNGLEHIVYMSSTIREHLASGENPNKVSWRKLYREVRSIWGTSGSNADTPENPRMPRSLIFCLVVRSQHVMFAFCIAAFVFLLFLFCS